MAQPRKYLNDAERYKAYRDRKKERVEQMALDLRSLKRGGGTGKKRVATFAIGDDALKQGLLDLRKGIRASREEIQAHRRLQRLESGSTSRLYLTQVLDWIEQELDRLIQ